MNKMCSKKKNKRVSKEKEVRMRKMGKINKK
jgi:hypothetical protein